MVYEIHVLVQCTSQSSIYMYNIGSSYIIINMYSVYRCIYQMFFLVHREMTRKTLLIHPTEPTMVQGELADQPVC